MVEAHVHKIDCQNVALDSIDFLPNSRYRILGDVLINASTIELCRPITHLVESYIPFDISTYQPDS